LRKWPVRTKPYTRAPFVDVDWRLSGFWEAQRQPLTSSHLSTTDLNWTKLASRVLTTGDEGMKKSRYTEEQIAFALRQAGVRL
jgi:hypothetical protein